MFGKGNVLQQENGESVRIMQQEVKSERDEYERIEVSK
jgi:hypothetical protein